MASRPAHWSITTLLAISCAHVEPRPAAELRVDAPAQAMLDAWAQALGGREAIARFEVVHSKGEVVAAGLDGALESWVTARGEERVEISLANGMRYTRVYDGARGWLIDYNREVRELAGSELDDAAEATFLDSHAALVPGRLAGRVSLGEGGTLMLAPRASRHPIQVTFDSATHLPSQLGLRDGAALEITHLSGWRVVDGVRIPFVTETGRTKLNVALTTVDHQPPPPHAFEQPPDRVVDVTFESPSPVTVPVAMGPGVVFVPVEIGGRTLNFILDSGATSIIIDAARAKELGLHDAGDFSAHTVTGDKRAGFVNGVTSRIGGVTLHDQTIASISLSFLSQPGEPPIDGLLGYELFSRVVIEIDYAAQRLRLFDRETYHHDGEAIALSLDSSVAHAAFGIELDEGDRDDGIFKVDTGQTMGLVLSTPFVHANPRLVLGASVKALTHGKLRIAAPDVQLSKVTEGLRADPDTAGVVGGHVLSRFVAVFDYHHRKLWLDRQ